jgi:arginyl-tRNA synthetase
MMIESLLQNKTLDAIKNLYGTTVDLQTIQIQQTKKEFTGDLTIVIFPLLRASKKGPEQTAEEIGTYLQKELPEVTSFNVIKGFLNIVISHSYWISILNDSLHNQSYGFVPVTETAKSIMVEYSSPNTNKPLHLGHIRNNLLGFSVAKILEANGYNVIKANLVNDRGIHICKSMIAWQLFGNGETPQSTGMKGDHLVGKYYVAFDKEYKKQIETLKQTGASDDEAKDKAPIIAQAREMLRQWEAGDKATIDLWQTMNGWVYEGFDITYKKLGVSFDKMYYESQTYLLGKKTVELGLEKKVLYKKDDNSVWCDLTGDGLDEKLLLRPDGTSVYMTQDLGTAMNRFEQYKTLEELIYVVGNEQNYHFQVLKLILSKLGFAWSDKIYHLSYGMVELPEGRMKSREGTVVDADDLVDEMIKSSETISRELGKLDGMSDDEARNLFETLALGALKYFILKVEPKKTMTFNPKESIDFNGNTGPFIQYTHARISSLCRKAEAMGLIIGSEVPTTLALNDNEKEVIKQISLFPSVIVEAGKTHSPALIANYTYDLVKEYNQFYHDYPVLKEEVGEIRQLRLALSYQVGNVIRLGMSLLGINVPNRM